MRPGTRTVALFSVMGSFALIVHLVLFRCAKRTLVLQRRSQEGLSE